MQPCKHDCEHCQRPATRYYTCETCGKKYNDADHSLHNPCKERQQNAAFKKEPNWNSPVFHREAEA